jgi:hypothetical protein
MPIRYDRQICSSRTIKSSVSLSARGTQGTAPIRRHARPLRSSPGGGKLPVVHESRGRDQAANSARQPPVPRDPRGVRRGGRGGHCSRRRAGRRRHLLSGVLRSRLPRHRAGDSAARHSVPRTRLVDVSRPPPGGSRGRSRHRASRGRRTRISASVNRDGTIAGFRTRCKLDPSEATYAPGSESTS